MVVNKLINSFCKLIKMWSFLSVTAVMLVTVSAASTSFINFGGFMCPREEKALSRCLKDALNSFIPKLAAGLPEFDVPPCEPLLVPAISIQQSSGALAVNSLYSDVTVRGPSTMKIKELQVDAAKKLIEAKLYIPELRMNGHYKMSGQLLMLPVEGEGEFTATYSKIDATVSITLGRKPRTSGSDALSCEALEVKFTVGHATMDLRNLFGGDSDLGGAMNQFINENWQQLANELQTPLEEALQAFLKPLADHALATLNADDILT